MRPPPPNFPYFCRPLPVWFYLLCLFLFLTIIIITSHHIEKTDAGFNSLYIRDITVYLTFGLSICKITAKLYCGSRCHGDLFCNCTALLGLTKICRNNFEGVISFSRNDMIRQTVSVDLHWAFFSIQQFFFRRNWELVTRLKLLTSLL